MRQGARSYESWIRGVSVFGLIGIFLSLLSRLTVVDLDLFHELALIREILATGRFPAEDCFAYTPTIKPIVHHEWGTGAVLYLVAVTSHLGSVGLMLLKYSLSFMVAVGCFRCARNRGATWPALTFFAPLAIFMAWMSFSTIRAQLFTMTFLVLLLLVLGAEAENRKWWLVLWIPVYVMWLNMHAGFLVGLGLFGIHTVERFVRETVSGKSLWYALGRVKHLVASLLVMVLLLMATPYGLDYVPYLWRAVRLPRPLIGEWGPLWQGSWDTILFFSGSIMTVLYVAIRRGWRDLHGLALLLPTAVLACQHIRHLPIYALVWFCLVPAWIGPTPLGHELRRVWRKRFRFVIVFWITCGMLGFGFACHRQFWDLRIPTMPHEAAEGVPVYPAGAVDYLFDHGFHGNLMVPFGPGAYISWRLYPAVRVSIDSRYEVAYPPGALEESVRFYQAEDGWRDTLARYLTDAILVPWWSPIGPLLTDESGHSGQAGWQRIYTDDAYSLYVREERTQDYPKTDRSGEHIVGSFP